MLSQGYLLPACLSHNHPNLIRVKSLSLKALPLSETEGKGHFLSGICNKGH